MIVFLLSGLWHGASLAYVVWGGLNGLYQVIGELTGPAREKINAILHLHRASLGHRLMRIIGTFMLIDFSWIFFRAGRLKDALLVGRSLFNTYNPWILFDGSLLDCGLDGKDFTVVVICIMLLVTADICRRRGIVIREKILEQDYWFRWMIIVLSILAISLFGMWGADYNEANFIYFQF